MLKNEDIICISSIDWDFIWQGHQEIMTRLARNGNRVLFIENTGVRAPRIRDFTRIKSRILNWKKGVHGVRKIEEGLYVYSPLVLPFPYLRIARFINKRLMFAVLLRWLKAVGFKEPVVWTFLPTGLSLDLVNEIEPKVLVYYCIDSFEASSKGARRIKEAETLMLKRADIVFATSEELCKHCSEHSKNVHYFPFAVNIDNFTRVLESAPEVPDDIKAIKRPIAGYVGGVHKWIDFDLVKDIAAKNKDISFVFCGPIQTDISKVKGMPNIFFLGQKKAGELPAYVNEFDVALIPYRITEYTKNVYPTKLNEYLSLGKPVISTDLPEIIKFNKENKDIVKVAATKEDFADRVGKTVTEPVSEHEKAFAMNVAGENSWSKRLEKMSSLIENIAYEKISEREKTWKDNLSRIYKKTWKKFIPAAVCGAIGYMLIFHTPLLWFLAKPLKISNIPLKADAIVAFGGGVGESGKVGQGYEERVDSATRLYNRGLADKIVYSSGYRYIMKEASVMKALSVSMGVEESDILLDDSPSNTYQMVMNLRQLMEKNGWEEIILISSPYHMLRIRLLCDKHLQNATVYLVPVEQSSFYTRGRSVDLKQLKGIIHEYLAILHYKLKGYL